MIFSSDFRSGCFEINGKHVTFVENICNKDNKSVEIIQFSIDEINGILGNLDEHRIIAKDLDHSTETETRWYCTGKIGRGILTVRFTYRNHVIRIFGAGYWRKGKKYYEENHSHPIGNEEILTK